MCDDIFAGRIQINKVPETSTDVISLGDLESATVYAAVRDGKGDVITDTYAYQNSVTDLCDTLSTRVNLTEQNISDLRSELPTKLSASSYYGSMGGSILHTNYSNSRPPYRILSGYLICSSTVTSTSATTNITTIRTTGSVSPLLPFYYGSILTTKNATTGSVKLSISAGNYYTYFITTTGSVQILSSTSASIISILYCSASY